MTPYRFKPSRGAAGRGFLADRRGVAAIEFALVVPAMLVAYLGGFAMCEACAIYRKLADATVETANATAQYSTMQNTDAQSVMGATAQIMAPYSVANLTMVMTLIATDANSKATVTWSQAYNGATRLPPQSAISLPQGMAQPSSTYILITSAYKYIPLFGTEYIPSILLSDQIIMLPRQSSSIPCTSC